MRNEFHLNANAMFLYNNFQIKSTARRPNLVRRWRRIRWIIQAPEFNAKTLLMHLRRARTAKLTLQVMSLAVFLHHTFHYILAMLWHIEREITHKKHVEARNLIWKPFITGLCDLTLIQHIKKAKSKVILFPHLVNI